MEVRKTIRKRIKAIRPIENQDVYDITTEKNHNFFVNGILAHNCGETPLVPYSCCNLSSINLHAFCQNNVFNFEELYQISYGVTILMDNIIDKMIFPDEKFKINVLKYRPIGIGFMGASDTLYELGIPYDSLEGRNLIAECMKTITTACVEASSDLALEKGKFSDYDKVEEDVIEIMKAHTDNNEKVVEKVIKNGLRNCHLTMIAPTGSVALSCDCSYGIEPSFGLVFTKTLIESGDKYVMVNPIFKRKYENESWYGPELLEKIVQNKGSLKGLRGIPREVRDVFVVAHDIKPKDRIDMQASVGRYVSAAISSTINLPSTTTVEEISDIYKYAYQKGLKGITIYRDGSKKTQPISFTKDKTQVKSHYERPTRLQANVHIIEIGNGKMYVTVSTQNGKPVELFIGLGKSGTIFHNFTEALGRTISISLQHGVPTEAIVKTLIGINSDKPAWFRFEECDKKPAQLLSIPDAIAQLLQRYYVNGAEKLEEEITNGELCPKCGTHNLVKIEGCSSCSSCGYSMCG